MINKNYKLKKTSDPFPYVVIDDFFSNDFYNELEKFFPKSEEFKINNVGRMHGDTTFGDDLYNNLMNNSEAYKNLHNWVYSENFINFFIDFFKPDLSSQYDLIDSPKNFEKKNEPIEIGKVFNLNNFQNNSSKPFLYSRLDLGYGKKDYGVDTGGRGPHIDNPQRLISILIYIGGYSQINGGEHRIYKKSENELKIFDVIKPIGNRVVASLQNNVAFHDVNPVKDIVGQRNAFYLAISASKKIWKSCERNKINVNFNKNRVKESFFKRTIKKFFN